MSKRALSAAIVIVASLISLPAHAEITPQQALDLAIAKFHAKGRGVQGEIDDKGGERMYFVQLCPRRLKSYDDLFKRLNGDQLYFLNLSEACPNVIVTDSDGFNYVAVDGQSGEVSFLYPENTALAEWKKLLLSHPLHVWNQADAESIVTAMLDLTGDHSELALTENDLRGIVHESFDEAVTKDCDRTALRKQFAKWWRGYQSLGITLGKKVSPLVHGYRVELTYGKRPDFVQLDDYYDIPRLEQLTFTISDQTFEVGQRAMYPDRHRWGRNIECNPISAPQ
jgi:hypothetical protein